MDRRTPPEPVHPDGAPASGRRHAAEREARLAAALRANLRRRKTQSRARQDAAAGEPHPGPSTNADQGGET